jgi:DNA-binding GntR family transcriptional regulator
VRYTFTVALTDGVRLRRTTTAQQLADQLSERILSGAAAPGHRLRESAIATELGVARNTVREAVRLLELAGLVHYEVNRGAVVVNPTPETLHELYASRAVLELAGVRAATAAGLGPVEAAYDRLAQVAHTADATRIVPADLGFHAAIVGLLGNARIDSFYGQLARELHFYLMFLMTHDDAFTDPAVILTDHRTILEALQVGATDVAAAETIAHLDRNEARALTALDAGH